MSENNYYALLDKPTPQNLEANRRGSLTLEQRRALEGAIKEQQAWIFLLATVFLSVAGYMIFFLWQVEGEDGRLSLTSIVAIGLVTIGSVSLLLFVSGGETYFFIFSRDEIENGQVESVIGKVVWLRGRYRTVSDSRKLRSLYRRALPPPGDYRFYCLSRSGLVIMAEELGFASAWQASDLFLEALAGANHFSMADLESNHQGSLSVRQELRLFGYVSWLGALTLLCIGICVWAVQSQRIGANLVLYVLLSILGLILLLRISWSVIRIFIDIWNGKVEHTDGLVTRHIHHARNTLYYTYQINNLKFHVSRSAYNALIEGRQYRVYFAPRSKRLVAIEPLGLRVEQQRTPVSRP